MSDIVTSRQLAKRLGVHYQTIYNWRRTGLITPIAIEDQLHLYNIEKVKKDLAEKKDHPRYPSDYFDKKGVKK